jgi:[pyruvate, water dikinase]-phosphate phosphotransferase / [pyruvate, water dikinase] kinase
MGELRDDKEPVLPDPAGAGTPGRTGGVKDLRSNPPARAARRLRNSKGGERRSRARGWKDAAHSSGALLRGHAHAYHRQAPSRPHHSSKAPMPERTVFFVSDGTGITAETFGNSILSQFAGKPRHVRRPFIDTPDKAHQVVREIDHTAQVEGRRPIVFVTLVDPEILAIVKGHSKGLVLDMFNTFIEPLEAEFGMTSNHRIGRFSDVAKSQEYTDRIEAINFSLAHDDGQSAKNLAQADVILVGVSRSGKTPTSLYLAMQHGIKAANYPLIPEDFERGKLPSSLAPFKAKCFGLTIDPERLNQIRHERRPNSRYASLENCRYEVAEAETMMRREGIAWLSSTHKSIEEIATTILRDLQPERLMY